jgi:hypothetical protein
MAINDISQYYTLENGTQIANDNTFASLAANSKVKNKNTGSTFVKNSNYQNVFDRYNTFNEFVKATDFKITNSGSGNGVSKITWTPSSRTITQYLTNFTTPSELSAATSNLNSRAVGSISVSGTTVTYKNLNGQTLGSFQTQDNNTTYSANKGIKLTGTTFGHSLEHADNSYNYNGTARLFLSGNNLHLTSNKITFDKYGHMSGLSGGDQFTVDLSSISGSANSQVGKTIRVGMIRQCFCTYTWEGHARAIYPGTLVSGNYLIYGNHIFQVEDDDKQWSYTCDKNGIATSNLYGGIRNDWTLGSNTTWVALSLCHGDTYADTSGLFMCVEVR